MRIDREVSDPIVGRVVERLMDRSDVGISKYGVALTRGDLSTSDWLQHLQDELLDGANYAEVLKGKIELISRMMADDVAPPTDFEMVQEFIEKFDADHPAHVWMGLVIEEFKETLEAFGIKVQVIIEPNQEVKTEMNKVEVLDGICDLKYVLNGLGHSFRWNVDEAFREVHRSNMTKLGEDGKPIRREEDGKILKGPNFEPPKLKKFIEEGDKLKFGDITGFRQ